MVLGLTHGNNFYGVIGTETTAECNGQTVCVGDIVHVLGSNDWDSGDGLVLVLRDRLTVMGLVGNSMDNLIIESIVKSHKDLKVGEYIHDTWDFMIKELKGFKEPVKKEEAETEGIKITEFITEDLLRECLTSEKGLVDVDTRIGKHRGLSGSIRKQIVQSGDIKSTIESIDDIYSKLECEVHTFEIDKLTNIALASNVRVAANSCGLFGKILTIYYIHMLYSGEYELVETNWAFTKMFELPDLEEN